jgi:hypothetical protein
MTVKVEALSARISAATDSIVLLISAPRSSMRPVVVSLGEFFM